MRGFSYGFIVGFGLLAYSGCAFLPQVAKIPVLQNPFAGVQRVAVAPFFNLSEEPTVDGRQFALAYYNALQAVPGFEVIPVGQVERAMQEYGLGLNTPQEACRLAELLGADAIVIGAVTDYSPYYPPRLGLRVEWYPADPAGHAFKASGQKIPSPDNTLYPPNGGQIFLEQDPRTLGHSKTPSLEGEYTTRNIEKTPSTPSILPLVTHTRIYNGHDVEFTAALSRYHLTRDDARFAGWQTYLERSDDFIRFCCYKHLEEMLIQQGGASQTKLVWRWSAIR